MKNLIKSEVNKIDSDLNEWLTQLNQLNSVNDILDKWYFRQSIPVSSKNKKWDNVNELKQYIANRLQKESDKKVNDLIKKINVVQQSDKKIESITISVDWKPSRTWGNNPQAEVKVNYIDNTCLYFQSSRVTGCGYDKESTAIAEALNQCNELKNLLYTIKNKPKNIGVNNRNLFGYGSGYGNLPYFKGGVGTNCYYKIFDAIGFKMESTASGKVFDVWTVRNK